MAHDDDPRESPARGKAVLATDTLAMNLRVQGDLGGVFGVAERIIGTLHTRWGGTRLDHPEGGWLSAQVAPLVLLGKATKTFQAMVLLSERGYGEDALMLLRTLFETALTVRYIAQAPFEDRGDRWMAYAAVTRYEFLRVFRTDPMFAAERERVDQHNDPVAAAIDAEAHRVQQQYHFWRQERPDGELLRPGPWAGITIGQMARSVGWGSQHASIYRLSSEHTHSGVRSPDSYLAETEGDPLVSARPGPAHIALVLQEGCAYLLSVMGEWCRMTKAPEPLWRDLTELRQALREEVEGLTGQATEGLEVVLDQQPWQDPPNPAEEVEASP